MFAPNAAVPARAAYDFVRGPWRLDDDSTAAYRKLPAPAGMCELCWSARLSDDTPGLTYRNYADDDDRPKRMCANCVACAIIDATGEIAPYGRWPLVLRDVDGRVAPSPRGVRVLDYCGPEGEKILLSVTSTGLLAELPIIVGGDLPPTAAELRKAYAETLERLDILDPLPDFADGILSPTTIR